MNTKAATEVPDGVTVAHFAAFVGPAPHPLVTRARLEAAMYDGAPYPIAPGATVVRGAGNRAREIPADEYRLPFDRDWHRIHHSKPWRRLAGKCQVYIDPDNDHLRTRMTHAIEVAQVAETLAKQMGLNTSLARAAALAHDCGHGPAGHASEDALSPFVEGGYDHAVYGADVILEPLNLCVETLDAVRNHSWRRPAPSTPEGEVVAWADRIAYVCHDFEDAVANGVVKTKDLPDDVKELVGTQRHLQLNSFITAMLETTANTGVVGMRNAEAGALQSFRDFNFQNIYLRPAAVKQAGTVIRLISSLVEFYIAHPSLTTADVDDIEPASNEARAWAVQFVSGMTDRFALQRAVEHLGWDESQLPRGVVRDSAIPELQPLPLFDDDA